jgi:hypothetical protein
VNPIPPVRFVTSVQKPHRRNQPGSMKGKSNRPVETVMCEASVRSQLAQLTQAAATLQAQQNPLLESPTRSQPHRMATPDSASRRRLLSPEPDLDWDSLREDLPTGPLSDLEDDSKIYKLAKEVSRLGKLMTAGRDVHDIHTTLHLVSYWNDLQHPTRQYVQHRLRLLYLVATRGWPAAIAPSCLGNSGHRLTITTSSLSYSSSLHTVWISDSCVNICTYTQHKADVFIEMQ